VKAEFLSLLLGLGDRFVKQNNVAHSFTHVFQCVYIGGLRKGLWHDAQGAAICVVLRHQQ
jgi:hypothetical protein